MRNIIYRKYLTHILAKIACNVNEVIMDRVILHADMNNCYASIEAKLNPKLKNKPIAVCGSIKNRHGIVLAKSQEARYYGVQTGETVWQALRKCPNLIIVEPHYQEYLKYSKMARNIYYDYTNQVEAFGLDECWLDVSGSQKLHGSGIDIAEKIRKRIKTELGITVSIGVSFNKVFAKLGSDMKKPDAVTEISKNEFKELIWKLKVEELLGVGKSTGKKFNYYGIHTIGDLARTSPDFIGRKFGINGIKLLNYANGLDDSEVADLNYKDPMKSIGNGSTCSEDLINNDEVFSVLRLLSFKISNRLRKHSVKAGGIQIYIRDSRLNYHNFQEDINMFTQSSNILAEKAFNLFRRKYTWNMPVRALSIRTFKLIDALSDTQLCFLEDYSYRIKKESLDDALFSIRKNFGETSITFASLLNVSKFPKTIPDINILPNGNR